jgi:stage II sporulation protein D
VTTPGVATTGTAATGEAPSAAAVSLAQSTVVITGHGWGHALGMSQWGALGFAQHGWTYDRILAHYYRGTTLEQRPSPTVRVLLLEERKRVTLASESPWSVTDARGVKVALPPGKLPVGAALAVSGQALASPLAFTAGATPLSAAGKPYRGRLLVFSNGRRLQVVNALPLEQYVKGVVGYEMPSNWPAGALQAQAVAARTYALASLTTVVTARTYDLFGDTRSQVYGGIQAESPAVSKAVEATSRQVVLYDGKAIMAYYSSSTGGRTVSAAEALGKPIPYLVSVPDPYDVLSPNHNWGPVLFDARSIARALDLDGTLSDLRASAGPSGHVTTVTAVGEAGEATATGSAVRTLLGLRSTWFSVGWLSLSPPPKVAYGLAARLSRNARGVGAVTLEGRVAGGTWQPVGPVAPDASGSFELVVRPEATTEYRLAAEGVRAARVSVPVEPVVDALVNAGGVSGTVSPPSPGVAVQLQRQSGASWTTVATATPNESGSFAVAAAVGPGSYRIRWAPGRGLSPGVSKIVAVS